MRLTIVILMLALTACGVRLPTMNIGDTYTVKKGDTLYSIGTRYGVNYKRLGLMNNISPPYKIHAGQKLHFKQKVYKKTASVTVPSIDSSLAWQWPTKGHIISTYSLTSAGRKGIDIAGKSGQDVISTAPGKVVYSGNGLPRYGNLIIIKHNNTYLSAYAHNNAIFVKEGQSVRSGQKIASLGRSGTQQDKLHFEIRRNGKPVDPMKYLPRR